MSGFQRSRIFLPLVLVWLTGCQVLWDEPQSKVPQFKNKVPVPVSIQVIDERPAAERGMERSPYWLYFTRDPERHGGTLVTYMGNALNVMGAYPAYSVIGPEVKPDVVSHLIQLRLIHTYSRWPVEPDQRKNYVPVQGASEIRITLYRNGEQVHSGTVKYKETDFQVPVNIIRPGKARKIVGDALTHQFERTISGTLDAVLRELEKPWPSFASPKATSSKADPRLEPVPYGYVTDT